MATFTRAQVLSGDIGDQKICGALQKNGKRCVACPTYLVDGTFTCGKHVVMPSSIGECSICLCDINASTTYMKTECNHLFHNTCLFKWKHTGKTTCPLCRYEMRSTRDEQLQAMLNNLPAPLIATVWSINMDIPVYFYPGDVASLLNVTAWCPPDALNGLAHQVVKASILEYAMTEPPYELDDEFDEAYVFLL